MSGAIAEPPAANHWHIRLVDGEPERADCVNPDCPMNVPAIHRTLEQAAEETP